jgi:Lrp/AsnC family transcriptional regulator, regulator for asnA, asnC and gidA
MSVHEIRLSEADVKIIQCLQKDARSSVARIAKILRMPTSSVRHRLQKLVKDGVIKFDAMTNPLLLGYQVWVNIEIQVELTKLDSVARQLARDPEVYLVYIMTGRYDILVGAVFRTNEDFRKFITGKLPKIPGIKRVSSSNVLELVKRSMSFPLPSSGGTAPKKQR